LKAKVKKEKESYKKCINSLSFQSLNETLVKDNIMRNIMRNLMCTHFKTNFSIFFHLER